MRSLPLLALLFFAGLTYGQKFDFNKINTEGRQLVFSNPDSALVYIKKGLREAKAAKVNDTIVSDLYNLYGIHEIMASKFDSAIYYFEKSADYTEQYPERKVKPLTNIALSYRNKGDYDNSIKKLNDILKIKNLKTKSKAIIYGELASNYTLKFNNSRAIDYLLKAIDILKSQKNDTEIYALKQKLANIYMMEGNYDFAIDLYDECIKGFEKTGDEKNLYFTYLNKAEALIQVNKLEEAKKALKISIDGLKKFNDIHIIGIAYSKLGHIETREGQEAQGLASYQKAMEYLIQTNSPNITRIGMEYINHLNRNKQYAKSLQVIDLVTKTDSYKNANIEDHMYFYQAMADTYRLTGNYKKAAENYSETVMLKDSIASMDKENALKEIQGKFQNELQREKNIALANSNAALEQRIENNRIIVWASVIISLIVIALILFILRTQRLKNNLQEEKIKTFEAEKNLIEQQHQHDLEIIEAQKEMVEEKQRELTSSALRKAHFQDNLRDIIEKCDNNELKKVDDVRKELVNIIRQNDYWKQFEIRFNNVHPNFNAALSEKYPNITKNDIEFCSLLKLNLSNKEIASLLQISHESVITKKYRIKKKMEINDDTEFEKLIMAV